MMLHDVKVAPRRVLQYLALIPDIVCDRHNGDPASVRTKMISQPGHQLMNASGGRRGVAQCLQDGAERGVWS